MEYVDDFDREVAALGSSEKFTTFLDDRSKETGDILIEEIRKKRDMRRCREFQAGTSDRCTHR